MKCFVFPIVRLSFLVASSSSADMCPPDVVIRPCTCNDSLWQKAITCSNFTDVGALQDVFEKSGDWPFTSFILENSNVMYIPASAVEKKTMGHITIRNSTLTSLFDAAPNVENRVSHINLFSVKFQRGIRWDLMKNLGKLLDIKIESSEFRRLGKDFSDNVGASLRKFMMEDTKTTSLDDHVFARMKNMDRVHFQNCKISSLKRSMFSNPSRIYTFDFRGNEIENLPDDMFHGMPRLWEILLQGNRFKHFSESVFGGHVYDEVVMTILLHDNPLICDCTIRWLLFKQSTVEVNAFCAGPEDKKGLHVFQLDPKWFDYCPRSNALLDVLS